MNPQLTAFLVRKIGATPENLKSKTLLVKDLGCCGLDAVQLFEDFFTEFENIEQFDADLHIDFSPDFTPRPLNWIRNLLSRDRWKYLDPDVTIGHLERVTASKKWYDEREL